MMHTHRYRIVGPDEAGASPGYISMDSPMARALLGKALDSEIVVDIAGTQTRYEIIAIEYESG